MMCEERVQYELPVLDEIFTPCEIHELFSALESNHHAHSTSSSEITRSVYSLEEKRHRRKISNRESARRSRWRKKMHLEKLKAEANRLRVENREFKNRLHLVTHRYQAVQRETDQLVAMSNLLQQRLAGLSLVLAPMQLQNSPSISAYFPSSFAA